MPNLIMTIDAHHVWHDAGAFYVELRERNLDGTYSHILNVPKPSREHAVAYALAQTACDDGCQEELEEALRGF